MQAMSSANVPIESQTYVLAIQRLCDEKCVSEATLVLRSWIVEGGETPELRVFEQVAREAVIQEEVSR